jgi:outer membrane protein assembly factor BamB
MRLLSFTVIFFVSVLASGSVTRGNTDWPMWRYEAGRQAFADISLPGNPGLLWTRQLEEPRQAWPVQFEDYFTGGNPARIGKLAFDISYEPVVGGGRLFIPSMVSDRLTAYSAASGEELWRYYTGGPVRLAPVYDSGRVYFTSDDGYLYCLEASTGNLIWKYHGSFSNRMVLGNERLISMWPGRGGPVIKDGIIYFAAGVMPFEGVFVHAINADTGENIWTNSTSGAIWDLHQHGGAWSYGGPSPQGYLAVSGDKLIVPGGRTPPAVFDRRSGELLYFNQATGMVGKGAGGYGVFASDEWFINHGMLYALEDGAQFGHVPGDVITNEAFIGVFGNTLFANRSELKTIEAGVADRLQRGELRKQYELQELWSSEVENLNNLYFKTASHFAVSRNEGKTASLISVTGEGKPGEITWEYEIDGEIWSMIAGDGKLFIATREGKLYCFGTGNPVSARHYAYNTSNFSPDARSVQKAASIIQSAGVTGGYGMILGSTDRDLIMALIENSPLHFVVIEPDRMKAASLRTWFDNAGMYGKRVSVLNDSQASSAFLPYIYDLVVISDGNLSDDRIRAVYNSLRPYGGSACFTTAGRNFSRTYDRLNLVNGKLRIENDFALVTRAGSLPGSAQWTHQYGGASNRTYSDDNLVKPPLGTLWFGGPSNHNALPRHHNGPIPQVSGGRLLILGKETISARCVYTGRELWVREIPGIGHYFTDLDFEEQFWSGNEVYMPNNPGANFTGSPYVSLEEVVYVIDRDRLLSLDPASGEIMVEFRLPAIPGIEINEFSHLMVSGDYLITAINPQMFDDGLPGKTKNWNGTSSTFLLVMNRHSGEPAWTRTAETGFRHNAIVAGNDRVFLVDGLSEGVVELHQRRGMDGLPGSRLFALDIATGRELWSSDEKIFGTWLGYYEDKDILLQGGRSGQREALVDEPRDRLIAHNGSTGSLLWESTRGYTGPLGLHPDMIISGRPGEPSFNPYTGENILVDHPITGENYQWDWHKYYGCGSMNSSKYLVMFRSGTAGYADLYNFGGTSNFGGFRSGCTNSMVAAEGVLNSPDYTRTCTCSYPLQTSVGLVHMPDAGIEAWSLNRLESGNGVIRSLGINFGGQGNRREDGVLWLEYPKVYDAGPELPLTIESDSPSWFRNHATWIKNGNEKYNWVASYGIKGITSMSVDLNPEGTGGEQSYTVTLYFAEPENLSAGERVFDISLQGNKVLENFDIAGEAGGSGRVVRKQFTGIRTNGRLQVEFSGKRMQPVISGIEIIMDGQMADHP